LDELYGLPPEEFTARRKELVAAARKRGDADGAKLIGAARRPTTAAWVVNLLVRCDATARRRLNDLGDQLRAAHADMDGSRIRESTAAQRKLVDVLARAAFAEAGLSDPSAALRDDVTGTLQAAVADLDVAARLGRLTTAERWSGFGDFGTTSAVAGTSRRAAPKKQRPETTAESAAPTGRDLAAAKERRDAAAVELTVAQAARVDADDVVTEREGTLATARRRYETLLESLNAAEREVNAADVELDAARKSATDAAARAEDAATDLAAAEAALGALTDE
jgi:Asp/Glu/hydantoin racemase